MQFSWLSLVLLLVLAVYSSSRVISGGDLVSSSLLSNKDLALLVLPELL